MKRFGLLACTLSLAWVAVPAAGDGGYFWREGVASDLAQTRQEVVLAIQADPAGGMSSVTYVLRSRYTGRLDAFAWVIPVPATPTGVVAHTSGVLFDNLDLMTRPRFTIDEGYTPRHGFSCGCAATPELGTGEQTSSLVTVEAQGQAGVYDWAALTSSGSDALLTWLAANGYSVSASAGDILDGYIQQGWHFLAVRVRDTAALTTGTQDQIDIPPIQFTCQTMKLVYPMNISRVSAADDTEVVIYLLAAHRMESGNVPTATIDGTALVYDADSASLTNYETLFTQKIAELGGLALITEYAWPTSDSRPVQAADWPNAPPGAIAQAFLTRLRTVVARDKMDRDFGFRSAPADDSVDFLFQVRAAEADTAVAVLGQPSAAMLSMGVFCAVLKRRSRRRSRP